MAIMRGDHLHVTTASGETLTVRALGAPERGDRFPIVWVATETDWNALEESGEEPQGIPWPTEAVKEMASA